MAPSVGMYGRIINADQTRGVHQAHSFAVYHNEPRPSRIALLFRWGSPTAVPSNVVSIIVDAFKRLPRRSLAHICQEVLELAPPRLNADAPLLIVLEALGV